MSTAQKYMHCIKQEYLTDEVRIRRVRYMQWCPKPNLTADRFELACEQAELLYNFMKYEVDYHNAHESEDDFLGKVVLSAGHTTVWVKYPEHFTKLTVHQWRQKLGEIYRNWKEVEEARWERKEREAGQRDHTLVVQGN